MKYPYHPKRTLVLGSSLVAKSKTSLVWLFQMHVCEKFHVIPWLLIELVFCALWAFFYLTTAIDTAVIR